MLKWGVTACNGYFINVSTQIDSMLIGLFSSKLKLVVICIISRLQSTFTESLILDIMQGNKHPGGKKWRYDRVNIYQRYQNKKSFEY